MKYDKLLSEYESSFEIKEINMTMEALCSGKHIWINNYALNKRKVCLLAEEIGHCYTSCGNILDQTKIINQKQEYKARTWAFRKLLPYDDIVFALKCGYRTTYDLAEYFGLDEEFVEDCLKYYRVI